MKLYHATDLRAAEDDLLSRAVALTERLTRRQRQVVAVTTLAPFMGMLDVTIVNIAFPDIARTFPSAATADLSWVLSAYNLGFAAFLIPAGRAADRYGRKRVWALGVLVFLAASGGCALAPSLGVLVASRVGQAIGVALFMPASLALLLPEFPASRRATATSLWGVSGAVAAALGPALGGILVASFGWRSIFAVNAPLGALALALGARVLTERRESVRVQFPDLLSVGLLIVAVAALALGTVQGPEWGWGGPPVVIALAGGATLLLAFARRNRRHPRPLIEPALLRVRSFAVGSSAVFLFSLGFFASFLCNVLFLTRVWGYPEWEAGLALSPGPLMAALAAPVAGRMCDRFGQRVVAIPGALAFAIGTAFLVVAVEQERNYTGTFLPVSVLTGAGVGMTLAALSSAVVAELPSERYGTGGAVYTCVRQLGAVLGISLLIALLDQQLELVSAYQRAWAFIATTGLLAAATAGVLGRFHALDDRPAAVAASPPRE